MPTAHRSGRPGARRASAVCPRQVYHTAWGQLFKAGTQNSRWAQQVQDYACLYTSQVSNIGAISAATSFRALSDLMPHDRWVRQKNR